MAARSEDGSGPRRRPLYGRSRGKTLRAGQKRLVTEILPTLQIETTALSGAPLFAAEPQAYWLEIGFGAGEHLIEQAKANPEVGLIGCEPFLNGVAAALSGIEREGLTNVRLRRGDAQALVEAAPDAFFSRVFVLYPDPWPKRRHNKRRIVTEAMVAALARIVKPGGEVRFATDVDDYAGWTLRRFLASPCFRWAASGAVDWRTPYPEWRSTRYEVKAHKAGRDSVYFTFVRI
ncbi:tRNA (guanine-N7-)-methyltransferase [Roseiarcus fermentans]|uniref:tRNA (guanine-N(7)-)-methyltransferase n=1 Tax=Roseiarcus fermentans TaxID=1473586 RepID=A0A366EL47_9HYPH|nr:tRNA (guanosine(46)-N7)-methyltransferase TrmB [Roseiarcus fermentans]RBP02696.1 tRNA (guanine-N7-)-methyltransferase [Roseiarcus fermentans]